MEKRRVQVVNAGTEGYSTDQELIWLSQEGRRYAPDVVVLQMYENDIFWNSQTKYLHYPKPRIETGLRDVIGSRVPLTDPGLDPWLARNTALGTFAWRFLSPPELPMREGGPRPIPALRTR